MVSDLPEDWKIAQLGDFCSIQNGYPFKSDDFNPHEGIPLIRVRSLKTQSCDIRIRGSFDAAYLVQNGDIVIGMDGDFQPCWWMGGTALLNQRVCRLLGFGEEIEPFYVFQAIRQPLKDIEDVTHFTTVKHISSRQISDVCIPLPPLPEQRAIATTLRAVQDARDTRRRELALEQEHKAALMEDLFTYGVRGEPCKQADIGTIPRSWEIHRLGEISEVAYGLTVNQTRRQSELAVPYLTVANVTRGRLRLNEVKEIGMVAGDERFRLKYGDVLLVEGNGNPQLLGSAAVWNDDLPFALHQNHLIRARVDSCVALPIWVMCYLNSDLGRTQLLGKAKTSSGLHTINSRIVSGLEIPCPPLDEQHDIAAVLTACDQKIAMLERETALHDELFRALLDELMTGRVSALPLANAVEGEPNDAFSRR
jgi:type I restriction enzyme S subunit